MSLFMCMVYGYGYSAHQTSHPLKWEEQIRHKSIFSSILLGGTVYQKLYFLSKLLDKVGGQPMLEQLTSLKRNRKLGVENKQKNHQERTGHYYSESPSHLDSCILRCSNMILYYLHFFVSVLAVKIVPVLDSPHVWFCIWEPRTCQG